MRSYKSIILFFLVLTAIAGCRKEEKLDPTEVATYIKLIGDPESPLTSVDARQKDDGSIVLLANAEKTGAAGTVFSPAIVTVDQNGTMMHPLKKFDNTNNINFIAHSLTILSNSEYIVVGQLVSQQGVSRVSLMTYNTTNGFSQPVLLEDSKSGEIALGIGKALESIPGGGNSAAYMLVAQSSTLDNSIIYTLPETFSAQTIAVVDHIQDTKTSITNRAFMNNGVFYWAGGITSNAVPKAEFSGIKNGQIVDDAGTYPQNADEFTLEAFYSPVQGSYAFAGTVPDADETDLHLIYVGSKIVQFSKSLDLNGVESVASIDAGINGYLVFATTTSSEGNGQEDFLLARISQSGDGDFYKLFGGENSEFASTVIRDSDGGIIMYGYTEFTDVNTLLLIKCDKDGNL